MVASSKYPKKILLGLQEGYCNLSCPKCYTHGPNPISSNHRPSGYVRTEDLIRLLDEVQPYRPRIAPQTWDEPLLNPKLMEHLSEIKKRDLPVTMDTNGLLLDDEKMTKLIDLQIDSIFVSLDAVKPETYLKVRGVDRLRNLEKVIERFLQLRGDRPLPRLGVSFVIEEDNQGEVDAFVERWSKSVDVVRVNQQFLTHRNLKTRSARRRTACWSLDDSLMVHFNGEAALCCVDTHYENRIGNVFQEGVAKVWNGAFFSAARAAHASGNFSSLKICAKCDLWSHDEPKLTKTESLLISETTSHTYFNRLDRMQSLPENRLSHVGV